jgi:uncharacterized integral membrane protein
MKVLYTIIIVILMLFIITFSLANPSPIQLKYFTLIDVILPTYMVIFVSFLSGVVFTGFMGIVERFRLTRTINRLNKTIKELKREIRDSKKNQFVEEPELPQATSNML